MEKIKELTIEEEQKIQVDIIRIFDEMCKKEKITYFLAYGTLLGAIRSNGFIPWDDDIDLWIYRKDIKLISNIFYRYFDNNIYFLQSSDTDPMCVSPEMLRICVNKTFKWNRGAEKEHFHTGIYLDLIPLDNSMGQQKDSQNLIMARRIHNSLFLGVKTALFGIGFKRLLVYIYYHFRSRKKLINRMLDIISEYQDINNETDDYISLATAFAGNKYSILPKNCFSDITLFPFCDLLLPCPTGYKRLLSQIYGTDYMVPKVTKSYYTKAFLLK